MKWSSLAWLMGDCSKRLLNALRTPTVQWKWQSPTGAMYGCVQYLGFPPRQYKFAISKFHCPIPNGPNSPSNQMASMSSQLYVKQKSAALIKELNQSPNSSARRRARHQLSLPYSSTAPPIISYSPVSPWAININIFAL